MKHRLILSFIVICLGFLANFTLHSLINANRSLSETVIKPSTISSYTPTNFNLLTALKKFGDSKLNSKFEFSSSNPWLNYYYHSGTIRAKKENNSYVFFNDSDLPTEFRSDVNCAHINASGILFVRHDKLYEQKLDIWTGALYAVADNGLVYNIPNEEKQRFINGLNSRWLAYERMNTFKWYKDYIWYVVIFSLIAVWSIPLYRFLKTIFLKFKSTDFIELNITFKYKK